MSSGKSNKRQVTGQKPMAYKNSKFRKTQTKTPKQNTGGEEIRLNKYIANSGICTRREADIYIKAGAVRVNGKPIVEMGYKVKLGDEVKFDGKIITPEKKEYILLNKPKGFDTSIREETLHKSAQYLVSKASKYRLFPVGTLERNTSGLLLFTNDHDLIKKLTDTGLPIKKTFQVTLSKNLNLEDLKKIASGIAVDQKKVIVDAISYVENAPKNEIGIELKSNRKNIVRRIFKELGYEIVAMDRVIYAGLTKKDLPRGHWRALTKQEIINLKYL